MISILLPAYKSEQLLDMIFLKSFLKTLGHGRGNSELIIYDNGGNGSLFQNDIFDIFISAHGRLIGDGINVGLNEALNQCALNASGEYFFLPHTDMWLLPGWDEALLSAAKNLAPHTFLFCSRSIEPGFSHIPSQIIRDYGNEVDNFREEDLLRDFPSLVENKVVVNARMPFFMHRNLWEKINGVDSNYFSYCTDDDLIQSAYDVGVRKFYMIYSSMVYHLQGKSNAQQTVDKDSQKPYDYFIQKWKHKYPDVCHPGQYHPRLIPFEMRVK
jgi:GT2 family glycosyltransferase